MDFDKYEFGGRNLIWCHWDLVRFLSMGPVNFDMDIIGVCDYRKRKDVGREAVDLRIYFYREEDKYVIRVYKDEATFDLFQFDNLDEELRALEMLPYDHPEYEVRPYKVIQNQGNPET